MIHYLEGTVHHIGANSLTVLTGGVGRQVFVTPALAGHVRTGMTIGIHTELVVREDSLTLYGFESPDERDVFVILMSTSGVGPKLALAIVSTLSVDQIYAAVANDTPKTFTAVPGIGPKVAAKLMLDLKGKLKTTASAELPGTAPVLPAHSEVVDALIGLGWKPAQAESTVADVAAAMPEATVPELLKASLRELGGKR